MRTFKEHKRIIFNGNAYDEAWLEEAERRGLPNLVSSVDAIPHFEDEKSIKVFTAHKVFTEREIHARTEILLENYYKTINIEAHTVVDMVRHQYAPAVMKYVKFLCDTALSKKTVGIDAAAETEAAKSITELENAMISECGELEALLGETAAFSDVRETARFFHDKVLAKMNAVRSVVDTLEALVGSDFWPVPTYGDILFSVK